MTTQLTGRPPADTPAKTSRLNLPQSTSLVMGSIIGVGIFSLPVRARVLRPDQPGRDGAGHRRRRRPGAACSPCCRAACRPTGGPYAYARAAFGNGVRLQPTRGSYWITAWAGNAAIVVGLGLLRRALRQQGRQHVRWSIVIALVGLWIPAAVNLTGVRNMGVFQVWTTVLKFVPLALMATVGLFFIKTGNFTPWNTSGDTNLSAIGGAMAICLFSYLGVETRCGRCRQGAQPGAQRPQVDDLRHPRQRGRLHALADRRVRHPARQRAGPGQQPGVVLRRGQRDRRRHLAGLRRRRSP